MARFHSLHVYALARENLRDVARITERRHGFGDLVNQLRRAAISVVSNICEGAATGNDRQFARYVTIARASANELQGQLAIVADLGLLDSAHPIHDRCDHVGRSLTKLLRALTG